MTISIFDANLEKMYENHTHQETEFETSLFFNDQQRFVLHLNHRCKKCFDLRPFENIWGSCLEVLEAEEILSLKKNQISILILILMQLCKNLASIIH